jgi:hypothetical protein
LCTDIENIFYDYGTKLNKGFQLPKQDSNLENHESFRQNK